MKKKQVTRILSGFKDDIEVDVKLQYAIRNKKGIIVDTEKEELKIRISELETELEQSRESLNEMLDLGDMGRMV